MGAMTSQVTSLAIVYSTVYSGADQRKHQSSASLAFAWGIHRWPVNPLHKWAVARKMFPFDVVIMINTKTFELIAHLHCVTFYLILFFCCQLSGIWIFYITIDHDDVIKWKHFPRNWPFVRGIHRSPVTSPQKGQWRGALMFSLICVWINDWVNNRQAGDLRRYRLHYDVIVMYFKKLPTVKMSYLTYFHSDFVKLSTVWWDYHLLQWRYIHLQLGQFQLNLKKMLR